MKNIITVSLLLLIFCFNSINAQNLNDSLVGCWRFNGNANDESPVGNHGTVHGATLTSDRFGNLNSAYNFDGIDDYIVISDNAQLNPNNITISCWYKTVSFFGEGNNAIIDKGYMSHSSPFYQYHIGVTGNYTKKKGFATDLTIDTERQTIHTSENFWDVDKWYNLSMTYDGTNYRFYVNSVLIGDSFIYGGTLDNFNQDLFFGKVGNVDFYTPGVIDDIRIYSRALSSDEIYELYQQSPIQTNDTTIYYVCSSEFEPISPRIFFVETETFTTNACSCDSLVNRYEKYIFESNYYTDTIVIVDSISVTDTLIIDLMLSDSLSLSTTATFKIYPNPVKKYIIIECADYDLLNETYIRFRNLLGETVFYEIIDQNKIMVNINDIGSKGTYIVEIINNGNIISTKKIIVI